MGRALRVIHTEADRSLILQWVMAAPVGTRVSFQRSKRSLGQNALMWAMLTDVAEQVDWYGKKLSAEDWKDVFTSSLRKARVVPGIDPGTFVVLGLHTSNMDREELGQLIDLIHAFGAERGVVFKDTPKEEAAA